jgi:hypothetical protein
MTTQEIYDRAVNYGCSLECTCVDITQNKWDSLMEGHTRANRILVVKAAMIAGILNDEEGRKETRQPWHNPYNHYKTKTHLIYVHPCTEHFIKVNDDERRI